MKQKGFTLLEVVVVIGTFSAVTASCFFLLISSDSIYNRMNRRSIERSKAVNYYERLYSADYDSLNTTGMLKVIAIEPCLKLLTMTGESFCLFSLRSSK